jgi:hypothetical protein
LDAAGNSSSQRGGSPHRVHITGAARSGTTLMLALMMTCFDIDGAVTHECRLWRAPALRRRVVLTKQPRDEKFAMRLACLDPKLHVIYMLRDPREVVVSVHGSAPDQYWSDLPAWRRSVTAARSYFHHCRIHIVRYDELMRAPDALQQRLARAMPFLRATHPFSRFHEAAELEHEQWRVAMRSIRPPSPEALGSWRKHLPRLKAQIAAHGDIADELVTLGFEKDREWLALLEGVQPDETGSRPSAETLKRRFDHAWRDFLGTLAYAGQRVG